MERQPSLFEGAPKASTSLRLTGGYRRPLTPAQRTFNKLVARVENLRLKLSRETAELNEALAYYGEHIAPRVRRMTSLRKEICRALAPFLSSLKSKAERKTLREILAVQLRDVASAEGGLHDADLTALFERAAGIDFATARQKDFEDARNMMKFAFEDMGIHVDLSDFDPEMTEEDFAAHAGELAEKWREQAGRQDGSGRKTKKQLEREAKEQQAEEIRNKRIASVYKQLARVIHPDFESDPAMKQQKEAVMQELTVAYRENDLHTLLRLELEWVQHEHDGIERLTDEKLSVYNHALREQVQELEFELEELPLQPRYQALQSSDGLFGTSVRTDGPGEAKELDFLIGGMERDLARLGSANGIQTVKALIREFRRSSPF